MTETKRILKVPQKKQIREKLREEVALFVSENKILPPANMEILEIHAKKLLKRLNEAKDFLDFTMVLVGNEIWREVVKATPFHRRLLLLPQCLRNKQNCQGVFDELGLICGGCKNCQLDGILEKAEKLGYSTLVAEGTTVAIGLVEEGSIDAVVGVSCMTVLQKSFAPVTNAAVPAIGIPLLYDGCENTSLDYDWLFAEMEQFTENEENKPLSVSLLKNQVTDYFSEQNLKNFFTGKSKTEELALKMLEMGGHRMRPLLSVIAYQSYAETVSEEVQNSLALIIECFHKASLIHDDIEDDEDFRYDQSTLHKTEGIPMAINTGDYLIGKGYGFLADLACDASVKSECLKVISASHITLSVGQGADILLTQQMKHKSVDEVLKIFEQKTGEAVKVALLVGAIAGRASEEDKKHLEQFSEYFGIAYQIRDDLNEFREENELKHAFDFPFLLALLNRDMNGESPNFTEVLKPEKLDKLVNYFQEFTIEEKAEKYLNEYLQKCRSELKKLRSLKLQLSLYGVMGKIFK
jgi:geranylgeranyl pyrophosphate synthase